MTRLFIALIIASFSWAVELQVSPSKDINATDMEIGLITSKVYKEKHIKLTQEAAKKYLQENKVLSNAYLKEYKDMPHPYKQAKEIEIEEKLADEYIKKHQEKIKLDKETLLSYYVAHKKEFLKPKTYTFYPIEFTAYEEAVEFYNKNRNNPDAIKKYIEEKKVRSLSVPEKKINFMVKNLFVDKKPNTLLPPVYMGNKFILFYIEDVSPEKQMSFEEAKPQIRKKLLEKVYARTRKKLLEDLGVE